MDLTLFFTNLSLNWKRIFSSFNYCLFFSAASLMRYILEKNEKSNNQNVFLRFQKFQIFPKLIKVQKFQKFQKKLKRRLLVIWRSKKQLVFCFPNFLLYYDGKFFYCDFNFSSSYQSRQKGTEGKIFEAKATGRG